MGHFPLMRSTVLLALFLRHGWKVIDYDGGSHRRMGKKGHKYFFFTAHEWTEVNSAKVKIGCHIRRSVIF
jgi:predicted RNA binding protein YcfA (HicA-like mRNA interferase family)